MLKIARGRLQAASEEGFGLIEVIVSAAVLVMVVLGTMAALDAAAHTTGANQARTVAASLAEKDLERLRGYKTSDLNQLASLEPETRTVKVGKVTYTIASKAQLVDDASGDDLSCALPSGKSGYLRITSTVTSPVTGNAVKPVTMSSIVAPQPGKGTLTALVRDAGGNPVSGMPVAAAGPQSPSGTTNAAGCAIFPDVDAGSYTLTLNYNGWVDSDGNPTLSKGATVSPANLTVIEFLYDAAGAFPVRTVNSSGAFDNAPGVMAAHTGVSTGFRTGAGSGSSWNFTSMFPFKTPYEVYSGTCTGNNPENWIPDYFNSHPDAVAQVNKGDTLGPSRTVIEPSIKVKATFRNGSTVNASGANVYAYPKTDGCSTARISLGSTNSSGDLANGQPFGMYDLCVDYTRTISGTTRRFKATWTATDGAVANTDPNGTSTYTAAFNWTATPNNVTCGTSAP